jgi:anti-sigma factor RsiW
MTPHLTEDQLNGLADGSLAATERSAAEAHLAACASCRAEVEELRTLLVAARGLPRAIEPERDLWAGVEERIRQGTRDGGRGTRGWRWSVVLPLAATVVLVLGVTLWITAGRRVGWAVAQVHGRPTIDGALATRVRSVRPGATVETGATDSVVLRVGELGTVVVGPGSRARLVTASAEGQHLVLQRGTIQAEIIAPPRLFVVETPAAVATDLGCAYTLAVDSLGAGLLHVTSGWVELARGGRVMVVPYDAYAPIRPGSGPGTPFVDGAPPALRAALDAFDFAAGGVAAIEDALDAARPADAVSVMNLLAQTDGAVRAAVHDRLAALVPPPPGVTREAVLALERRAIDRWWDAIRPPRIEREGGSPKKKRVRLETPRALD